MAAPDIGAPKALADSTVLVAGGTSGTGLAAAMHFLSAGARQIALIGRNGERGEAARHALAGAAAGAQVHFFPADVNDVTQATCAREDALAALGRIDVLVNATKASYLPRLLFETDPAAIAGMLSGYALAPMLMSRLVLPAMREQRSEVIINVASDAAKVPTPGESVLGAAMAAIVSFTRTLAMEAKRDGIRVNALTPSLIADTPAYDNIMADPFAAKLFGKAMSLASLGLAGPDDLAALIVFLASPAAARITGQANSVNGGISAG